jgi:hypothetical protein
MTTVDHAILYPISYGLFGSFSFKLYDVLRLYYITHNESGLASCFQKNCCMEMGIWQYTKPDIQTYLDELLVLVSLIQQKVQTSPGTGAGKAGQKSPLRCERSVERRVGSRRPALLRRCCSSWPGLQPAWAIVPQSDIRNPYGLILPKAGQSLLNVSLQDSHFYLHYL